MKQCTECEQLKSLSEFNKDRTQKDGIRCICKECGKKYHEKNKIKIHKQQKEYYQIHKTEILERQKKHNKTEKGKSANLRKRLRYYYDITLEQYDKMVENQNGVCAICGDINKNGDRLVVDHDHETGEIRNLLCHRCNLLLGLIKENMVILQSVTNYLKKHKVQRTSEPGV